MDVSFITWMKAMCMLCSWSKQVNYLYFFFLGSLVLSCKMFGV